MAIIDCDECGKPMSSHAAACPSCGSPPPRGIISRIARWLGILFIGIVGVSLFFTVRSCNDSTLKNTAAKATSEAASVHSSTKDKSPPPRPPAPPAAAQPTVTIPAWSYSTITDEISGKTFPLATLRSSNTHDLSFPYGPGIGAEIAFRRSALGPDIVFIVLDKGQFLCHASDPCIARLKFDTRDERLIQARQPTGRPDFAILDYPFAEMMDDTRRARNLMIEMPVYRQGRLVWQFNVDGFSPGKL